MKSCDKCMGTGKLPRWPQPYTPLPVGVIRGIRENAPKCDKCNGTGEVENERAEEAL